MTERIILAYSGGLDTSVAIPWLIENYGCEVVTLTVDLGQGRDLSTIEERALKSGAKKAVIADGRREFLQEYVWPSLQAGALYEGRYPLATALSRPLIARLLVDLATTENATGVAHGCTGKGNDQVRLDVSVMALSPNLNVIAPAREWGMTREDEIRYATKRGIPISSAQPSVYSVDENIWGRSVEAGPLEDPWMEPPEEVFAWTKSADSAPNEPTYIEIAFDSGIPVAVNARPLDSIPLVEHINEIAATHGVGRIDHLENRLVGIKSREVYEAPAACVLHLAHKELERLTLSKDQYRFKETASDQYANLVYEGKWFSRHREDLEAYIKSTQMLVTGIVKLRLHKGNCVVVGRQSSNSLYSYELATYDKDDMFDHKAAEGFIKIYGLPTKTQAIKQASKKGTPDPNQ